MVAEFPGDVRDGEGGVVIELEPFHQVDYPQGHFPVLLHQAMAEEAFVGQLQEQSALGIAALHGGKAARALGQIQQLDEEHAYAAAGGEGAGLGQDIMGAAFLMEKGVNLYFFAY